MKKRPYLLRGFPSLTFDYQRLLVLSFGVRRSALGCPFPYGTYGNGQSIDAIDDAHVDGDFPLPCLIPRW